MKRVIYLVVACIFSIASTKAETITMSFSLTDFNVNVTDGVVDIACSNPEYIFQGDENMPMLPYYCYNVQLPMGTNELNDSIINFQTIVVAENVDMQASNLYCSNDTIVRTQLANCSMLRPASVSKIVYAAGNTSAMVFFSPFLYDYECKRLLFVTSINYEINAVSINEMFALNQPHLMHKDDPQTVEYLIITSNELVSSFMPLRKWRQQKGLKTKIVTIEDICNLYPQTYPQQSIKLCLNDYYKNKGTKYVLLGGDSSIIPVQRCNVYCATSLIYSDITPSDLYYSCFDGDWDWNRNEYGEIPLNYENDLTPELSLSRILVNTPEQVTNYLQKLFKYERNPSLSNYTDNILLSGCTHYSSQTDATDGKDVCLGIGNNYIVPYKSANISYFTDVYTTLPEGTAYTFSGQHQYEQINKGYHIVFTKTHGSKTSWLCSHSSYLLSHALNQTNINTSIILTCACHTNAFDEFGMCLSRAFIQNPNCGGLAYWGASRYGWSAGSSISYSALYMAKFFENLYKNEQQGKSKYLGDLVKDVLVDNSVLTPNLNASISYVSEAYHWIQLSNNLIGEPVMDVYTANPQNFLEAFVQETNGRLLVDSGVQDCTITIVGKSPNSTLFYFADQTDAASFEMPTEPCYITISKHNYVPWVFEFNPDKIYIQNDNISTDKTFIGNEVYVGNSVTDMKQNGNVIISNNADVEIKANKTVLDKGFKIEKGSKLKISK